MKYKSELIAEILEQRGHELPSLHYQSECVETWIEENKGAYPKLCDYESEWLNYIDENPIGEFPYETLTDVTTATVNNVVPFAYKSAILKGQTLVNLSEISYFSLSGSDSSLSTSISNKFKTNTDYTRLVFITKNTLTGVNEKGCVAQPHIGGKTQTVFFVSDDNAIAENFTGLLQKTKFTTPSNISTYQQMSGVRVYGVNTGGILEGYEIILEGDYTNQDIPYFEGMQSVKMPVLTTSNEDGTKTNILTVNEPIELRGIGDVQDTLDLMTGEMTERIGEIVLDGSEDESWSVDEALINNYKFLIPLTNEYYQQGAIITTVISDKYPSINNGTTSEGLDIESICINGWSTESKGRLNLSISKTKLSNGTVNELREYLSQNPFTVQYQLATESIKTVELTTVNEKGETTNFKPLEGTMHLTTSSKTINPLFSGEIPVEAITQNLALFIEG